MPYLFIRMKLWYTEERNYMQQEVTTDISVVSLHLRINFCQFQQIFDNKHILLQTISIQYELIIWNNEPLHLWRFHYTKKTKQKTKKPIQHFTGTFFKYLRAFGTTKRNVKSGTDQNTAHHAERILAVRCWMYPSQLPTYTLRTTRCWSGNPSSESGHGEDEF